MIKTNFYPLRTIVGSSIKIKEMAPYPKNTGRLKIVIKDHATIADAVFGDFYSKFLPDIIQNGITYHPVKGMNTMPVPESNLLSFPNIGLFTAFSNPSDVPFPDTASVASIFGYRENDFLQMAWNGPTQTGRINPFLSNRDKDYSFLVWLDTVALIGGICFQGYPYLSSRIENAAEGMTVGNFGLPREIRLTPLPAIDRKSTSKLTGLHRSQFIDSEFSYTRQDIVSHSGLNYLAIDPVKTNLFQLTLTDLPFIPKLIDLDTRKDDLNNPLLVKGFKGFAIPYLYFFEYKEQTKCNARLHSGLLGVKPAFRHLPRKDEKANSHDVLRRAFPEYEFFFPKREKKRKRGKKRTSVKLGPKRKGEYILYTAHSALGQRREFRVSYGDLNYPQKFGKLPGIHEGKFIRECFVSDLLQPNESVTLYLQQGEELERCIAGLKALFIMLPEDATTERKAEKIANLLGVGTPDSQLSDEERTVIEDALAVIFRIPVETNFCEKIGLRVFELDPIEGVSPASIALDNKSDPTNKYAALLIDTQIDDFEEVIYSQFLKGIPFRRTSSSKYFAIELKNKGRKNGQIAIYSLQLVRSAHVSVQPRPAKTQQIKTMYYRIIGAELADDFSKLGDEGFNFSIERVVAGQTKNVLYSAMSVLDLLHTGGARIQSNARRRAIEFEKSLITDDGIADSNFERRKSYQNSSGWRSNETGEGIDGNEFNNNSGIIIKPVKAFATYGNNETRTHNESLFPVDQGPWRFLKNYFGLISDLTSRGFLKPQDVLNSTNNLHHGGWLNRNWKGVSREELRILGTNSISASPFSQLRALNDLIAATDEIENPLDLVATLGELYLGTLACVATGGASSSLSISPGGVGASLGFQPYPQLSHATLYGTSGNIVKQAFETGYSFGQFLARSADIVDSKSLILGGEMKRIITRREVPNTDMERVRGAEIMWQDKIQDIITGSIPLNFILPATATKMSFRTADDALRVRFNSGFSPSIEVDFWFELTEETIRDDY
jgi:hypothetical protein